MKQGVVIKSTGSWYSVRTAEGEVIPSRLKGKFRMKDLKSTNPVAVGDNVTLTMEDEAGVISEIHERKNFIVRKSSNLSKQKHILASNIDQALLIVTINYPITTSVFIDRFLASAEAYGIPVTIVFNKIDRYDNQHMTTLRSLRAVYERIGYKTIAISAKKESQLGEVQKVLTDKVTMISGHSGVGKSTLVNKLEPSLNLKTSEISDVHQSGKHTTTYAQMHPLGFGGYIIDTPGIRGFGLIDIEKDELYHYFRDIFTESENCQYNNCSHTHEPGCSVKSAVEIGGIAESRYQSYLSIFLSKDEKYR